MRASFWGWRRGVAAVVLCAAAAGVAHSQPPPAPQAPAPAPVAGGRPQPPPVPAPGSVPQVSDPTAQPVAPATPVAPTTLKITGPAGLVLHVVLPAATGDFELVMARFFDAVAKVGDEGQKAIVAGWRVARVVEGAPGGVNALYVFAIDPVVPDADYSGTFILEMIYKAFPDEAPDLHRKFTAAYAGPRHVLTLTPLLPASLPPAAPPAPK